LLSSSPRPFLALARSLSLSLSLSLSRSLALHCAHQGETEEAYNLLKDLEPASPQEYILKGVVNLAMGQALDSREHLKVSVRGAGAAD
jgi:hypothetical protein